MNTKAVYALKLSPSLKKAAARLAKEDGVSLSYWINLAIAQKIGSAESADYLRRRFGEPRQQHLRSILDKVPDNPPMPGDELPDDLRAKLLRG
jgi:hypothetical protein